MPLVEALYVPNAPNLIAPEVFGGVGADTVRELRGLDLGRQVQPDVVVVVSPHWVSEKRFLVQQSERIPQVFDFSGFPPELGEVMYSPPGDPALAARLVARGVERGIPVTGTTQWGLDHGAWAPLMHLLPDARIPVVPLSIKHGSPSEHLAWGKAIGSVLAESDQRVALLATGSITHSFARMRTAPTATWPEGERVEKEILDLIMQRRYEEVAKFDPRKWSLIEPEGDLGPFFVLAGAIGKSFQPRLVSTHQMWGAFSLTILEFTPG
ncbi:MAG: dioxygenase [Thermoplasmata archaeon]|nr:dioxygenase [Thermoplasmata archaeon]